MKNLSSLAVIGVFLVVGAVAFTGSDDKFLKKYAMMKIYESCFGPEVVKQIRKEMKSACAKCASFESPPVPSHPSLRPLVPVEHPGHQQQENPAQQVPENDNSVYSSNRPPLIDTEKLYQAILAYRPNQAQAPSYRPFSPISGYYPFNNPMFQGGPLIVPAYQQQGQFSPYAAMPFVGQPYYSGHRMSREMDVRSQLEALTSRISGKVKNVTCVMQELGYLDENLEPNYVKISERISNLPVTEELRKDMQDGVSFCQQFSQCVPEIRKEKSPLSRELIRPMFFFKCYKHKKLEACVMKDVREKYSGVVDEDLDEEVDLRRQGKSMNLDNEAEINDLASSMYDFLYGSDSGIDIDAML